MKRYDNKFEESNIFKDPKIEKLFRKIVQDYYKKTGNIITTMGGGAFGVENGNISVEGFTIETEPGVDFEVE